METQIKVGARMMAQICSWKADWSHGFLCSSDRPMYPRHFCVSGVAFQHVLRHARDKKFRRTGRFKNQAAYHSRSVGPCSLLDAEEYGCDQ